jgi:Undecaprenyl-phosphate galactose phosphotransferase WbaP
MQASATRALPLPRAATKRRRLSTFSALLLTDLFALLLAASGALVARYAWTGEMVQPRQFDGAAMMGLFVVVFGAFGLYPGIALNPVDEFRRVLKATTLAYLLAIGGSYLVKEAGEYSRLTVVAAWFLTVVLATVLRGLTRAVCAKFSWWGVTAVVMGAGRTGHMVMEILRRHPELGLRPVALLDDDAGRLPMTMHRPGGAMLGSLELAPTLAKHHGVQYAIVAMPGVSSRELSAIVHKYTHCFPHVLIIPDLFGMSSLWVSAKDLGGMLGLEVNQALIQPMARLTKRTLDLAVGVTVAVVTLPLQGLIWAAVWLSSPGPVLFGQQRVGLDGEIFTAWKFRTMGTNADELLAAHLAEHPELLEQWNAYRKLRGRDPRVTWVGRWLRKTSLDELPQIWNVLAGHMSLIGPRPIMVGESDQYGSGMDLYCKVRPGITGLWQISGRANTTFQARVEFDEYYVRNWSVWLDLWILARTVKTVLLAEGAY